MDSRQVHAGFVESRSAHDDEYRSRLQSVVGRRGWPRRAKDPITEAAIRTWCEAVGDFNPAYQDPEWALQSRFGGIIAPATTLNMWTLPGNRRSHPSGEPLDLVNDILSERGFTSVAAVNNDHTYVRPLRRDDHLSQIQHIAQVSEEKETALGRGHFVDLVSEYVTDEGERVGEVLLRMLRWNPATGPVARSAAAGDANERRLPERPVRPDPRQGGSWLDARTTVGRVLSYLQPTYAEDPLEERPYVIADVELTDGSHKTADVVDVEPDGVHVGMPVELTSLMTRSGCVIPVFRPRRPRRRKRTLSYSEITVGTALAPWAVPVTQLSIAALATATFDFNDVHLDRDAAHARGARDVYMNILGSSALANCFLTDWIGPEVEVKSLRVRLAKQNHPGDTVTFGGKVARKWMDAGEGLVDIRIRGYNSLGEHLIADVVVSLPGIGRS